MFKRQINVHQWKTQNIGENWALNSQVIRIAQGNNQPTTMFKIYMKIQETAQLWKKILQIVKNWRRDVHVIPNLKNLDDSISGIRIKLLGIENLTGRVLELTFLFLSHQNTYSEHLEWLTFYKNWFIECMLQYIIIKAKLSYVEGQINIIWLVGCDLFYQNFNQKITNNILKPQTH